MTWRAARLALAVLGVVAATGGARAQAPPRVTVVVPRYLTAGGGSAALVARVAQAGLPVPDGMAVSFVASLGIAVSPAVTTTLAGVAVTRMAPGPESGFARLDAVAGGERGSAIMWVRPGPAAHVVRLEAGPPQLAPGGRAIVTGTVVDAFGNPAEGDAGRWEVAGGTIAPALSRVDHGQVRADFVAGPDAGVARLRLVVGAATGTMTIPVVAGGPRVPPQPVWLPLALGVQPRAGTCDDVLVNGSFERWDPGAVMPAGWCQEAAPYLCRAAVTALAGEAVDGTRAVRLRDDPDTGQSARLSQEVTLPGGARSARVWLWARGGSATGGLDLAVWSTQAVGLGGAPALWPFLIDRIAVPEAAWMRLAVPVPQAPSGTTRLDLTTWLAPAVDIDGVRLEVCW